jgi:TRAP-type mannitol/chloroaromatic compound transport system substrate-binding protein
MPKKSLTLLFVLIIGAVLLATQAQAGKVMLKLQSQFPSKLPTAGPGLTHFVKTVEAISDKNLKIKVFEVGKLVPPNGVLEAVSKGQVDAGYCTTAYWAGKLPTAPLFLNVPFGPEAPERFAWLYEGNGLKLWQEMYDRAGYNVKVLPVLAFSAESAGWFANPINSVEDLKGLKIRYGGFAGDVMKKLGASVTMMPMGDVFPALEKGALDGCEFSAPTVDAFLGFSKVVKYNYFPGWHQPPSTLELLINKDVWEKKLTSTQRAIIETAAMANMTWGLASSEAAQAGVLIDNAKNKGVKNMTWSPEMLAAFSQAWEEVAKEQAEKDPFFKKTWEDLSAFRANYSVWGELGYLPRNCSTGK